MSGALCGLFLLFPVNEALYYFEHIRKNENPPTAAEFILNEMMAMLYGQRPFLTVF